MEEKIALYGGTPTKTTPYGKGKRFGKEELANLEEALEQNTLFYWFGNMTKRFCEKFAIIFLFRPQYISQDAKAVFPSLHE